MDKLIAYASQFDPQFAKRIRGSSRADIAAFAALLNHSLPVAYEGFLETFGEVDGGLKLAFDGSTCLQDVMDFYREYVTRGEVVLPPGCLAIGVDGITQEAICLKGESVVFTGNGSVRGGYCESLEKLLFRTVFMKIRFPLFAHQKLFLGGANGFAQAKQAALRLGFREEWFSDAFMFCSERSGELLILAQYERQPLSLHFACADGPTFDKIDELVHQQFGLKGNALQES